MKKTQFIELLKIIKSTKISFISITLFVTLSVAMYMGISGAASSIPKTMDKIIDDSNFHDVEIVYPYGITEEDLARIETIDGVDKIEGTYTGYVFFELDKEKYQTKLLTLNESIDKSFEYEGLLPTNENEIGIDKEFAKKHNLNIGDTISFLPDNDGSNRLLVRLMSFDSKTDNPDDLLVEDTNSMAYLKTDTYKITALMRSPEFICTNLVTYGVSVLNKKQINCFMYVSKSAFDESAFLGYPDIIITSNSLKNISTFTEEYKHKADALVEKIKKEALDDITNSKCDAILAKIDEVSIVADKEFSKIEKQISEGKKLIEYNKIKIENGEKELLRAEEEYEKSLKVYNALEKAYAVSFAASADIKKGIVIGVEYLVESKDDFIQTLNIIKTYASDKVKPETIESIETLINYVKESDWEKAKDFVVENVSIVDELLLVSRHELDNLKTELEQGKKQIADGRIQLENGKKELRNAEIELNNSINYFSIIRQKYDDGIGLFREHNGGIGNIGYSSITRNYNPGYMVESTLHDIFKKLRFSLAALFVIVGLLVCYSAISRIINDQTIRIGTKKALGLNTKEITTSYLLYTCLSVVGGLILGNIAGYYIVESIVVGALEDSGACEFVKVFTFKDGIIISLIELVLLILITYLACQKILKKNAKDLLSGTQVIEGKERLYERTKIWNKLSLYTKTIINNFFNDKRRVIGTIIGIAGSTALIVTALTFKNNIMNSFNTHFEDYYHFDSIITYDNAENNAKDEINKILEEYGINKASLFYSRIFVETPSEHYVASSLLVPENKEEFRKMVTIEPTVQFDSDTSSGYWLSNSYQKRFKTTKDDKVKLTTFDGKQSDIVPSGYFNFYLTDYANIFDPDTYEQSFNDDYETNAFIIDTTNINLEELKEKIYAVDGFCSFIDYYGLSFSAFQSFQTVAVIMVAVYMFLAVLMSFLVLLNLLTMFVDEKRRELIVLMINGFSLGQAKKYIYSDTILLSIISMILGTIFGTLVGNISVTSFESEASVFLHGLDLGACIIGIISSILLTFIVSLLALGRIKNFKLTDINKL